MSNILATSTTNLRRLLSENTLPREAQAQLNYSLNLVDLAAEQFTLVSKTPSEEASISSGIDYHNSIKPFLRIASHILTASEVFLATRASVSSNLSSSFETAFSDMLTKLEGFCEKSVQAISKEHPQFKEHFGHNRKTGNYLQIIATATFNGGQETPISQTELAKLADVSTAAATGIRDSLCKNKYVDMIEVKGDRRKLCTLLNTLGWKALAYVDTKEVLLNIKRAKNGLSNNTKPAEYSIRVHE